MESNRKVLCLVSLSVCLLSAGGCGHKNPLMTEEMVSRMKSKFFFETPIFPIVECSAFYAGHGDSKLRDQCEQWTAREYKASMHFGEFTTTTTLENFRDPQFWKMVNPK